LNPAPPLMKIASFFLKKPRSRPWLGHTYNSRSYPETICGSRPPATPWEGPGP
jgi:hypothetical protein